MTIERAGSCIYPCSAMAIGYGHFSELVMSYIVSKCDQLVRLPVFESLRSSVFHFDPNQSRHSF